MSWCGRVRGLSEVQLTRKRRKEEESEVMEGQR